MAKFDPYEVLGLRRDLPREMLTQDDFKAAYRIRVKQTHPDHGGSSEAFDEVQRAYDVLSDPAKRAKYDATGQIDGNNPDNIDAAAANMITEMLGHMLGEDLDPVRYDVVGAMRQIIEGKVREIEIPLAKLRRSVERAEKMRARFKMLDNTKASRVDGSLAWLADTARTRMAGLEKQLDVFRHALGLLSNYTFEREPDPSAEAWNMVRGMHAAGYGSTAWTGF